jgi:hypothetical protein
MDHDRRRRVAAGVTTAMIDGLNLCSATSSVRPGWCAGSRMDALDRLPARASGDASRMGVSGELPRRAGGELPQPLGQGRPRVLELLHKRRLP